MNARWKDYCLTVDENPSGVRTLACVREDKDGWVWHARNSYSMSGEMWFGYGLTEQEAMAAAEKALREEFELLQSVFTEQKK